MNFASDNTAPVVPEIMDALRAANEGTVPSYGADPITARVRARMDTLFGRPVVMHPVATGTAANALALATMVRPYGAVICHDEAHIATDECGAPEFYMGGAKLVTVPSIDGRITPDQIEAVMGRAIDGGVHHVLPEAVSITQATEWGTVYSPEQVAAISAVCRKYGLKLHLDGARLGNAVAHLGCSPSAITWQAGVDALSFGATKGGAMAAEAVVFFSADIADGFERRRKRAGQVWSKMRFMSAQLDAYLEADRWLQLAWHANRMASRLGDGLAAIQGVSLIQTVQANEVFAAAPEALVQRLERGGAKFYRWIDMPGVSGTVIRLVTAYSTQPQEVEAFLALARGADELANAAD